MIKKSCLELFRMIDSINIAVVFLKYCQQLKLYLSMLLNIHRTQLYLTKKEKLEELVNVEILLYTSDGKSGG